MQMNNEQFDTVRALLGRLKRLDGGFYAEKLKDFDLDSLKSQADFERLPMTNKEE
jgi:phenylacetate-CoA ligase